MTGDHRVEYESCPRRVRTVFGNETIADSTSVLLVRETGHRAVYYFPRDDVAMAFLSPIERKTHCPYKGDASYWTVSIGDRSAESAAWGYLDPLPQASSIRDHIAFYWKELDHWYEEDEEVFVHARDPRARVDTLFSRRLVEVTHAGTVVARTERAQFLFETGLPTRYYIPSEDVRRDLLVESQTVTRCPYKGIATHLSFVVDGATHEDVAWVYPDPIPECPRIANHICFYNERVDRILVDGRSVERPHTAWSRA